LFHERGPTRVGSQSCRSRRRVFLVVGSIRVPSPESIGRTDVAMGTVKWFNMTKGYGFITPEGGGQDVSCTSQQLRRRATPASPKGPVSATSWSRAATARCPRITCGSGDIDRHIGQNRIDLSSARSLNPTETDRAARGHGVNARIASVVFQSSVRFGSSRNKCRRPPVETPCKNPVFSAGRLALQERCLVMSQRSRV